MHPRFRSAISTLSAVSLVLGQAAPAAFAAPVTREEYEACQAQDEGGFRSAIEAITQKSLEHGIAGVNYQALVGDQWRRLRLDETLDKRVDAVIAEVRDETSWAARIQSLADSEKAKELATTVAERVYRSDDVKAAIEGLATGVGKEIGKRIELASTDAAEPALQCLKAFLGPRYGTTIAATVAGNAGQEFGIDPSKGGAEVSSGAVLRQSGEGITGAAILVMRRQLANMAARIGQRLVGSVLSRLVSVVAGGVGLVLIAKDIWEFRHGVLPIIAEEMKAKATKDKVQEELAASLSEQIREHVGEIGTKSAGRVVEIWQEFRRAHTKALDLAERHAGFRSFLDTVAPDTLGRLDEVTSLVLQGEGEAGILKRLDDGSLDDAVKSLPAPAMDIARETRSLDTAMKWAALGAGRLPDVVGHELYRRAKPDDFTKTSLERLFAIGDHIAIVRLASLSREARDILFERGPDELKNLARAHTETELATLARYLTGLVAAPRKRVLDAVIADAGAMQVLSSDRVRDAILSSRDQAAAVDMMLRPAASSGDTQIIAADFRSAWEGQVSPVLIWEKHASAVAALGGVLFLVLLLLRRVVMPRRRPAPAAN